MRILADQLVVVDTNHGQVVGNRDSRELRGREDVRRHLVVRGKNARRTGQGTEKIRKPPEKNANVRPLACRDRVERGERHALLFRNLLDDSPTRVRPVARRVERHKAEGLAVERDELRNRGARGIVGIVHESVG
ncbi:MAG: hypothetical protein II058_06130, partial [Rhodocyclaceae bacterium]|nr:hypothetical protein [Rhodocyclaceae bacterium]